MNRKLREYRAAFLFLIPTIIGLFVFRIYPIFKGIIQSFYTSYFQGGKLITEYVGLENYFDLFTDSFFWNALWNTLKLNILMNPIQIFIALILALLLTRKKTGVNVFRSIYMIPIGMSLSVASVIWRIILSPNNGLANGLLNFLGIASQPFFTDASQALWCIILLASWKGVAYWMIFIIGGLKDISPKIYEAAEIDGANLLQKIYKITLPLLKRIILFVLVADTCINFILFTPMYIITRGGPMGSTNVLMYEAYRSGFMYGNFGRSMAIVTILLITVLIVVLLQFKFLSSEE